MVRLAGTVQQSQRATPDLERIRGWTRERFALEPDETITAAELVCREPGRPPQETVVVFRTAGGQRHRFKIFKAAAEVTPDDLPYAWMKRGLAVAETYGCDCC